MQLTQDDLLPRQAAGVRARLGVVSHTSLLYGDLTAEENLRFYADLYGVEQVRDQVERYLHLLGLWDRRDADAGTFSKGMKQKLAIARALLHEPPVLFLDEPTSALDPESARTVRDSIEELRGEGRTILLCTHNLDEAERLCDRIAVFRSHVLALDTPENLRRRMFGRQTVVRVGNLQAEHVRVAGALPFARHVTSEELGSGAGRILVDLADPESENPALVRALVAAGAAIQSVEEARHSLEDVYLGLVQESPS